MKKLLKRLGVLAMACVLAGLLAELIVVVFLGEQVKFPRHVVGADFGLRINLPGAEYRHKSPDVDIQFRINSQGMRADRDFAYEKPPGKLRILSLGDSFTIGYEVELEECFSSVMERELIAMGYDVEVINAGVSGYSTAEECLYLERELIKYDPDLVLVSYYSNDVRDNVRSGLFDLDDSGKLVQKKDGYVPMGAFANYLNTSRVFSLLSQYSNAFSFAKNETTNLLKTRMVEENVMRTAEERGLEIGEGEDPLKAPKRPKKKPKAPGAGAKKKPTPSGQKVAKPGASGAPDAGTPSAPKPRAESGAEEAESVPVFRGRQLACAIYERIYGYLKERDIPLVVQSIPYLGEDDETGEEQIIETFPAHCFNFRRPGVSVVYAKKFLDPMVGTEQLYWLRSNRHWTPAAHRVSGQKLANHIQRWKLLGEQ